MYKRPDKDHVIQFIAENHQVEVSKQQAKPLCDASEVKQTYMKKLQNPAALGHLRAITYLFNLIDTMDFPARHPDTITNKYKSEETLFWLKETHIRMMAPFLNDMLDPTPVKPNQIGTYRIVPAQNTVTIATPPPLIPAVMFNWIKELATLHHSVKDKVDTMYAIDKTEYQKMNNFINQIPLFFSTVQPFQHANNRLGRFVANIIRVQWRIPFKYMLINEYEQFKVDMEPYQRNQFQIIMQKARDLKNF